MVVVAYWLGNATEQLADKVGSTWGGMMNAAFSNLPELIFGLIAVAKGLGPLARGTATLSVTRRQSNNNLQLTTDNKNGY